MNWLPPGFDPDLFRIVIFLPGIAEWLTVDHPLLTVGTIACGFFVAGRRVRA